MIVFTPKHVGAF